MKKLTAAVLLLTMSLLSGCYKQDYSLCELDENCVLLFELEASSGSTDFTTTITSIDVALFKTNGDFSTHARVEQGDLELFQGVKLTVDPGTYYVVAWGNVSNCSELSTNNGVTPTPFTSSYLRTVSDQTGCNLYYAPSKEVEIYDPLAGATPDYTLYEVEVKPNQITRKQLDFIRANRRVHVYLKGFEDQPQVQLQNIPDKYDYYLRTFDTRKNYRQPTQAVEYEVTGEILERASFRAPIVPFEDQMMVNLVQTTTRAEEIIKSVNLSEWYEANKDKISDINRISILFSKLVDGNISVEVANWKDDEVKPIW